MLRCVLSLALFAAACTPAQAPIARTTGKVLSISGVVGLIATALVTRYISSDDELLLGFSVMSGVGIVTYAYGDLNAEPTVHQETIPERNHRWATILTERAAGAAREGRCARVRRLEVKVRKYDSEVHDFVFMKDPEIVRCLEAPPEEPPATPLHATLPDAAVP